MTKSAAAQPHAEAVRFIKQQASPSSAARIFTTTVLSGGLAFIGDKHARELENVNVQSGDVLLNITGDSVARVCQVPNEILPARVNQHVAIIRPKQGTLDARFLHYFLIHPQTQAHMLGLAGAGATRNALTKGMIENFEIKAPSFSEQRAIASVLGALDDKIELNRRMNETLEALAQSLFKSWFVDTTQSALPKGWRAGTLGVVAENPRRGIQPDEIKADTAYIGLEHMPRDERKVFRLERQLQFHYASITAFLEPTRLWKN